jgi:hypothetical protein
MAKDRPAPHILQTQSLRDRLRIRGLCGERQQAVGDGQLRKRGSDGEGHADRLAVPRAGAWGNTRNNDGSPRNTGRERQGSWIDIYADGPGGALNETAPGSGHIEPGRRGRHGNRVIEELRGHARAHGNAGSGRHTGSAQFERKRERRLEDPASGLYLGGDRRGGPGLQQPAIDMFGRAVPTSVPMNYKNRRSRAENPT